MARLNEHLKYFVNMKISTDKSWQGITVYLSGHEVIMFSYYPILNKFLFYRIILMAEFFFFFFVSRLQGKVSTKLWSSSDQKKQSPIMIQTQDIVSMA